MHMHVYLFGKNADRCIHAHLHFQRLIVTPSSVCSQVSWTSPLLGRQSAAIQTDRAPSTGHGHPTGDHDCRYPQAPTPSDALIDVIDI